MDKVLLAHWLFWHLGQNQGLPSSRVSLRIKDSNLNVIKLNVNMPMVIFYLSENALRQSSSVSGSF